MQRCSMFFFHRNAAFYEAHDYWNSDNLKVTLILWASKYPSLENLITHKKSLHNLSLGRSSLKELPLLPPKRKHTSDSRPSEQHLLIPTVKLEINITLSLCRVLSHIWVPQQLKLSLRRHYVRTTLLPLTSHQSWFNVSSAASGVSDSFSIKIQLLRCCIYLPRWSLKRYCGGFSRKTCPSSLACFLSTTALMTLCHFIDHLDKFSGKA